MKGNIITQRPWHNGRLLTNSHLILPLYSPFQTLSEARGIKAAVIRFAERGPAWKHNMFADEKKKEISRGKIKQARTCSLEKCFNYIQKNVANKGGN